jgi:hypothetical protein
MGHGLKNGIIEFDGAWNEQGGVSGLSRHYGRGLRIRDGRRGRADEGFIFNVVWGLGDPLGREGGVKLRQRESLIQMPRDQAQALRSPCGRQSFPRGRLSTRGEFVLGGIGMEE